MSSIKGLVNYFHFNTLPSDEFYTCRFRNVPTFGRDTIRRFANNVSELKKLGARDYENLLQVLFHKHCFYPTMIKCIY